MAEAFEATKVSTSDFLSTFRTLRGRQNGVDDLFHLFGFHLLPGRNVLALHDLPFRCVPADEFISFFLMLGLSRHRHVIRGYRRKPRWIAFRFSGMGQRRH